MGQVRSVCAGNRSQSLALSSEKALPLGHPDRGDSRICNRNLFGGALIQRRTKRQSTPSFTGGRLDRTKSLCHSLSGPKRLGVFGVCLGPKLVLFMRKS